MSATVVFAALCVAGKIRLWAAGPDGTWVSKELGGGHIRPVTAIVCAPTLNRYTLFPQNFD